MLVLIAIFMSALTTSLILTTLNQGRDNAAHTQVIINQKLDKVANQTRDDAIILASLQNQSATHAHKILEQINMTINKTK